VNSTQPVLERQDPKRIAFLVAGRCHRYNSPMNDRVRLPIVAGSFYPAQAGVLREQLRSLLGEGFFDLSRSSTSSLGLISPHAGYMYSGSVAAMGFRKAACYGKPDVVVILGASHTGAGPQIALSPYSTWATPLGKSPVDRQVTEQLLAGGFQQSAASFAREHSLEVQLPFIQYLWGLQMSIVPLCVAPGSVSVLQDAAYALVAALGDRNALVIASSDFNHFQPADVAQALDHKALDRILAQDVAGFHQVCTRNQMTICGTAAIEMLLWAATKLGMSAATLVKYATSADITGDWSSVVGYASVVLDHRDSHCRTKETYG